MKDLISALGLLLFIEGLFFAIFPTRIKKYVKYIEKTSETNFRCKYFFFNNRIFNCLVYKKLNENI